jgi:integrase
MVIPTTAEVGDALHHAPERFTAFVAVCAFGGLRLGEAGGLRVSDIDFMRRELHVQRQVQRVNGGGVDICPPKFGSARTVYVPQDWSTSSPSMCAFTSPAITQIGGCSRINAARRFIRTRRSTCGTGPAPKPGLGYRLHDLRHFVASGLIAAGCDVVTVQRAMGHSAASFTLNTYSHLWPKAVEPDPQRCGPDARRGTYCGPGADRIAVSAW